MVNIWKDIEGYEGLYQINELGEIKAFERTSIGGFGAVNFRAEHIMKKNLGRNGYLTVRLSKNNKGRTELVHRLLAKSHIPNPSNKPCVNHKNGIKTDNRIENLEWVTYSENNKHAIDNKLKLYKKGKLHHNYGKKDLPMHKIESTLKIKCFCTKTNVIYESIAEAAKGINRPRTKLILMLNGKIKNTTTIIKISKEEAEKIRNSIA